MVNPTQYDCNPCEQPAGLLYVSPTQINFVVPDNLGVNGPRSGFRARVVLIRDGVRYDNHDDVFGGSGLIGVNSSGIGDSAVFGVGYECLYSFSLADPTSCGVSWSQGQHRGALGASDRHFGTTDHVPKPVRQGEVIILWMTGLIGLSQDPSTGLLQVARPGPISFGVAQTGKDIPATVYNDSFDGFGYVGQWATPPAPFAGESPQFVGLDQVNVTFPVCAVNTKARSDQQYDAFLSFGSIVTATAVRIYLPFVIRAGDPDCQFLWASTTPTGPSGTTVSLTSSLNPSVPGQSVTFTATVTPSTATGTVSFLDGSATLSSQTLNNGVATFSTSNLAAGVHGIKAVYSGDNSNVGSSIGLVQTVSKTATTTTLTSSPNPSTYGQPVTFVASVSPIGASGTVTFSELTCSPAPCSIHPVALGNGTLNGGKATFSSSMLPGGSHRVTANYNGDTTNSSSTSATLTQVVNKLPTTMTMSSSPNPSIAAQPVTFTATVSPSSATGSVVFADASGGGSCSASLSSGRAQCSVSSLSGGQLDHSITATYSGDNNYSGSTASLVQTVKQPTGTTLTSSPNPSFAGQAVTFSAFIAFSAVTGTVTFLDGATALGTGTLSKSVASFATSALAVGSHSITAAYSGDGAFGASTSLPLTQVVTSTTPITLTSTPNPSVVGQSVIITATVTPSTATGTISVFDGTSALITNLPLSGGKASFSVPNLAVGTHGITATYNGDSKNSGGTSAVLIQTVTAH